MNNNQQRGYLISKSLHRVKRAIREGFYLEAIVLVDSLVTDRVGAIANYSTETGVEVRGVNQGVRILVKERVAIFDTHLIDETLDWGKSRNAAVHGFSKLGDFEDLGWNQRIKKAKQVAEFGFDLAKRWLVESKKHRL